MLEKPKTYDHCSLICDNKGCSFKRMEYQEYVNKLGIPPCKVKKAPCIKCGKKIKIERTGRFVISFDSYLFNKLLKTCLPPEMYKAWEEGYNELCKKIGELPIEFFCFKCEQATRKEIENNITDYNDLKELTDKVVKIFYKFFNEAGGKFDKFNKGEFEKQIQILVEDYRNKKNKKG